MSRVRVAAVWIALLTQMASAGGQTSGAGPLIVVETSKGQFSIRTYPRDAPKTVAHVLALVRKGFYDGQRVHRAIPSFLIQWGDPRSRIPELEPEWGRGVEASSGTPIGAAEISKNRPHLAGAVGIAHPGRPASADSQMYVTLAKRPELDGSYAVFGQVISGVDVPEKIERGDQIIRMYVQE
jgi:cyclophilin family peptidyl-prolyl cis-trans isomerase